MLMSAFEPEAQKAVGPFIAMYRPNYPVGWNPYPDALGFLQIPVVAPGYVPKIVFIDRKGTIQAQYVGTDDFFKSDDEKHVRAELDKMLKPASPAKKKAVKKAVKKK